MPEMTDYTFPEIWSMYQAAKKRAEDREKVCKERHDIIAKLRMNLDDVTNDLNRAHAKLGRQERIIKNLSNAFFDLVTDNA